MLVKVQIRSEFAPKNFEACAHKLKQEQAFALWLSRQKLVHWDW
jgi:hypothetical protein